MSSAWPLLLALVLCPTFSEARRPLDGGGVGGAVMGGRDAPRGRYPWMVLIFDEYDYPLCGGSLIAPSIVLSAAHCFVASDGERVNRDGKVRIGGWDTAVDVADYEVRRIKKYWPHAAYPDDPNNDIALVLLDRPSSKKLALLPPHIAKPDLPAPANSVVHLLGWGGTGQYQGSSILQEGKLLLQAPAVCAKYWKGGYYGSWRLNPLLCAGNYPGYKEDACAGDSGGPLFLKRGDAAAPRDVVIGLVNEGLPCENVWTGGEPGKPGIYTDVAQFIPWIQESTKALTGGTWLASIDAKARVHGFDNSTAPLKGTPGQPVQLLTASAYSLLGTLTRASSGGPDLGSLAFRCGERINVEAAEDRLRVRLNGQRVQVGSKIKIKGGVLELQARAVIITQPGLVLRAKQPCQQHAAHKRTFGCAAVLEVAAKLTKVPDGPLGGLLGQTFKASGLSNG